MMHMLLKLSKDIYLYFTCYCCLSNDTLTTVNMIENARKVFRQNFNQSLGQGYKQLNLPTPSASRYLHFHRCIVLFYFREPQNRAWNLFHFQPSAQTLVSIVVQLLQVDALLIAEVLHPYLKKEKIDVLTPFIKLIFEFVYRPLAFQRNIHTFHPQSSLAQFEPPKSVL